MTEEKIHTIIQKPEFPYDFTVVMKYKVIRGEMVIVELRQEKPQLVKRNGEYVLE